MFPQQQGQRQQMPGVVQMPQQVQGQQVQHMAGQMPMQMGNPLPQQSISGMQQSIPSQNVGMQRPMSSIGQQHAIPGGAGIQPQIGMGAGVRGPVIGGLQQQGIMVKTEPSGQSPQLGSQRMPASNQPQQSQPQEGQNPPSHVTQQDRIMRFKQLLPQLKECLVSLISIARQNFAANATIDNLEKTIDTSLIPRFDKALQNFYSICNQIELNLIVASDQISHAIFSVQYSPLTANQMKDNVHNPQVSATYINTVKQQLAYVKEIQGMLAESSEKILTRQKQLEAQQQQQVQQQQRGPSQF